MNLKNLLYIICLVGFSLEERGLYSVISSFLPTGPAMQPFFYAPFLGGINNIFACLSKELFSLSLLSFND